MDVLCLEPAGDAPLVPEEPQHVNQLDGVANVPREAELRQCR